MVFEEDVFVSYAHIDDQTLSDDQRGWISTLHRALAVRLAQLLGKEPRIWRDPKLQGNDVLTERLLERLPRVAAFVSVLSPRYIKSEWCQRELNGFLRTAVGAGGCRVGDKLRIFKVVKTPIPLELHPPELQQVPGYEFFTVEPATGRPRELSSLSPPDAQRSYWAKLDDLAHDLADLLQVLESHPETPGSGPRVPAVSASMGAVYLAETSFDLRDQRDAVKRDLQGHGYTVLPDQPLPLVGPDCEAFAREQLARCRLSVHLVGQNYGVIAEGCTESIIVLQNELAIERSMQGDFCRLIWIPPDLTVTDQRQQRFLEQLQTDPRFQSGADLLMTPLEDFKSVLHVRLAPPKPAPAAAGQAPAAETRPSRIYLICDPRDLEMLGPLEDYLFNYGFEVTTPVFDGDESQVRQDHEDNLTICDAALIYYGAANELWLRSKLRELQKIAGYGRSKPMAAKAVYVAPPETPQKQRLRTHEALVITQGARFEPAFLEPFVSQLQ